MVGSGQNRHPFKLMPLVVRGCLQGARWAPACHHSAPQSERSPQPSSCVSKSCQCVTTHLELAGPLFARPPGNPACATASDRLVVPRCILFSVSDSFFAHLYHVMAPCPYLSQWHDPALASKVHGAPHYTVLVGRAAPIGLMPQPGGPGRRVSACMRPAGPGPRRASETWYIRARSS